MFHDGSFEGLWIDAKFAHIFLATGTRERYVLVAHDVEVLKADDVRQGNIIFDVVEHTVAEIDASDLGEFCYGDDVQVSSESNALFKRAGANGLVLLQISSSYGATCVVLAKTFELLGREEWAARTR